MNRESKVSTEVTNLVENIEESPRSIVGFLTRYKGVGESKVLNDLLIQFGKLKLEELNHSADRVADFLNRNNGWRSSVAWYRTFSGIQREQKNAYMSTSQTDNPMSTTCLYVLLPLLLKKLGLVHSKF